MVKIQVELSDLENEIVEINAKKLGINKEQSVKRIIESYNGKEEEAL